jgi:hypothetical protein
LADIHDRFVGIPSGRVSGNKTNFQEVHMAKVEPVITDKDELIHFLKGVLQLVNSYALKSCGECRIAKYLSNNYDNYCSEKVLNPGLPDGAYGPVSDRLEAFGAKAIEYSDGNRLHDEL